MLRAQVRWAGRRLRALLPEGTPLPDEDWSVRHRTICMIALVHAPALVVFNIFINTDVSHTLEESLPVLALAAIGCVERFPRRTRELATTLALTVSSASLVHASGGLIEAHFHFFVVVALVTLYQQWGAFALAIGFVLLHHGIAGMIDPRSVYNHAAAVASPWSWAAIHAAFIAMASAVGVANWKFNETARDRAESYYSKLYEGSTALVSRLRETNQIKSDLVSAVSHEFRTPLTAILGFLETLEVNPGLDEEQRQEMTRRAGRQARRLERLVINLLEAERALGPGAGGCDAQEAVETSIAELRDSHREENPIDHHVDPGLRLPVDATVANLLLVNLMGNALKFATPDTTVNVSVRGAQHDGVVIEVANQGPSIPEQFLDRIFEPFTQVDSSSTREVDGVGLGLHLVRRTVTAHGGSIAVTCHFGVTTFTVQLPTTAGVGHTSTPAREATYA